jgi:hypothetical protein
LPNQARQSKKAGWGLGSGRKRVKSLGLIRGVPLIWSARLRRRVALAMAFAVLLAGFAQAAHFHKDDLGQRIDTHLQCLLCAYSAGSATPPALTRPGPIAVEYRSVLIGLNVVSWTEQLNAASYEARGPPSV